VPKRSVEIVSKPGEILKLLPMGISIPLWPEFTDYILFDLKHFNARSLLLKEEGTPTGHVLVFYAEKKILYFGFFGVLNEKQERIERLIVELIEFARKHDFEAIKGPVNIPTIIYGWGFMEKGSSTSLFVHNPVNSPLYSDIFRQKGFTEVLKEYTFEGNFSQTASEFLKGHLFNDYELVVFDTWEEIANLKVEFLKLNVRNLSPRSVVTPSSMAVFDNYLEFIKQYGDPSMVVFTRLKRTNKLIGCFIATPNPFDKNSIVLFSLVLDKKHRNKGLGWWMVNEILDNSLKLGIDYCTAIVGAHVDRVIDMSGKIGLLLSRTHTVFSYSIKNIT